MQADELCCVAFSQTRINNDLYGLLNIRKFNTNSLKTPFSFSDSHLKKIPLTFSHEYLSARVTHMLAAQRKPIKYVLFVLNLIGNTNSIKRHKYCVNN